MSDSLEEFYLDLCSRCLCNNNRGTESELSKTVIEIKNAINHVDEKSRLLSLSIVRLACELLKTRKPCVLIYNLCERVALTACPILLDCMDSMDPFVSYLSRKSVVLLVQQFPDTCSSCVAELCDRVSTGTSRSLIVLVDILRIKFESEVSDLSLAGQEIELRCCTEVNPDLLISRRNIFNTQKSQWICEIEKHAAIWFNKFNFIFTPIMNLWCQLAITSLDMQTEDVISSLTKFPVIEIMQNLIVSQKSTGTFIATLKNILTSSSLSNNLHGRISKQFLMCINEDQLDKVCKRNKFKKDVLGETEQMYDHVIVRNIILCCVNSLLNEEEIERKNIFQNLFILLKKCNRDLIRHTYEELIISLFLDQDDEIVNIILCHVDLYLKYNSDAKEFFSPFKLFHEFLKAINFDHSVLLDMLMSNETRMLLLLVRFLKLAISEWSYFVEAHCTTTMENQSQVLQNEELDKSMSVFVKLNLSIERFECKGIFPYKVAPLLRLLNKIEECYEAL